MSADAGLRPLLFSIAYRMLGSVAEAEDVVQEAYLRRASLGDAVESERAWMTTVVTRLAIDVLRSARVRREAYVGQWLPEPLVDAAAPALVEDEESISLAFLVLLEQLTPVERAVIVLREAFDLAFGEIAAVVEREEDNVRQILSRARKRLDGERPRFDADPGRRDALAERFLAAARDGDLEALVAMLAADATLVGDGGGKARSLPRPWVGAQPIAYALRAFYRQAARMDITFHPVHVNGQPGVLTRDASGAVVNVLAVDIADDRVVAIHSMLNPDKLGHLGPTSTIALIDRGGDTP